MTSQVPGGTPSDTGAKTEAEVLADDPAEVEVEEKVSEEVTSDDEVVEEKEDEVKEPDDEDLDEEDEEKEEEEEEEEFDDSEITRPSWQEIKEKYPDLAKNKDFREMYHSERSYREVFPTVREAKEAAVASDAFNVISEDIMDGNMRNVFSNLEDGTLSLMAENFLPQLYEHNPKLFGAATRPVVINLLHRLHDRASKEGDDNLRKSVRNISKAITGNFDLPERTKEVSPEIAKERESLKQEKERLFRTEEGRFLQSLDEAVDKRLTKIIADGLGGDEDLTDFSKNAIVEKTYRDIMAAMKGDDNLKRRLMTLHRQAGRAGFTKEYKSRIVATYLERARRLVGNARSKHLRAALGKESPKGKIREKITTTEEIKTKPGLGRGVTSVKQLDTSKTSAEDFLHDRNVHLKE